jgi:putative transposase
MATQGCGPPWRTNWPGIAVQRCVVHKLRNLERHVPRHAHDDVRTDYHRIVYAESMALARQAYRAFDDPGEAGAESHSEFARGERRTAHVLPFSTQPVEGAADHECD